MVEQEVCFGVGVSWTFWAVTDYCHRRLDVFNVTTIIRKQKLLYYIATLTKEGQFCISWKSFISLNCYHTPKRNSFENCVFVMRGNTCVSAAAPNLCTVLVD